MRREDLKDDIESLKMKLRTMDKNFQKVQQLANLVDIYGVSVKHKT